LVIFWSSFCEKRDLGGFPWIFLIKLTVRDFGRIWADLGGFRRIQADRFLAKKNSNGFRRISADSNGIPPGFRRISADLRKFRLISTDFGGFGRVWLDFGGFTRISAELVGFRRMTADFGGFRRIQTDAMPPKQT